MQNSQQLDRSILTPASDEVKDWKSPRQRDHWDHSRLRSTRYGVALALLLGLVSAFAFEPVGMWPLMPLAFAALAELLSRSGSLKRALLIGWSFGVGQFLLGLNWIATAFTYQAAMPAWLGWIAVVLLSLYLAIYPAMAAGLGWRFGQRSRLALVLALAGGWAVTEYLRAVIFTGFAWNPVGATIVDTPWRETSATIGTYGLSALVVLAGGMVWLAAHRSWKAPVVFAAIAAALLTLPDPRVWEGDERLRNFDADLRPAPMIVDAQDRSRTPAVAPVTPPAPPSPPPPASVQPAPPIDPYTPLWNGEVRIVQPNIGQQDKWREGFADEAARRLAELSERPFRSNEAPPSMLFWPEAAVTEPLVDERRTGANAAAFERLRASSNLFPGQLLATGGLALTSKDGRRISGATNSVFVLDARGRVLARYDKAHLVPYGEYLPMRPLLSAIGLSRLAPGDIDFVPGPGPRTLALPNDRKMGVQICYEIIFSGEVVDPRNRPDFIFNPSNDAWFGAWGPPQHLAQARLRAAEEGLPVIRATPTGISALITADGSLSATVPSGAAGIIDKSIGMKAPPTPFARFGNWLPMLLAAALLIGGIVLDARRRYRTAI